MSVLLMSTVFDMDLPPVPKLVLLSIADFANDEGMCWPTQERIAVKASVSVRTVREHIAQFINAGLLHILEKAHGPGTKTIYKLTLKAEAASGISARKAEAASGIRRKQLPLLPDNVRQLPPKGGSSFRRKAEAGSQGSIRESSSNHQTTAAAARAREFAKHFGYEPTDAQAEELENYRAVHPPDCMTWALREIGGGTARPSPGLLRRIMADCEDLGHGPRKRRFEGGGTRRRATSGGADEARADGTHAGSDREKPLTAAERGGRW